MIAANEMNNVAPSGGDFFPLKASMFLFFNFQFKHTTKLNG